MTLLGSQQTALGSVPTASEPAETGGNGGGALGVVGKFTGMIVAAEGDAFSYLADPGQQQALAEGVIETSPQLYPSGARTISTLRVVATNGNGATAYTVTLYKNGAATAMQITVSAAAGVGAGFADVAHPIAFAAGDKYDLRADKAQSADAAALISAVIEGTGGGSGGGGGGPVASAVTGLTFPIVAGTPTLTAADPVVLPGLEVTGNFEALNGALIQGPSVVIDSPAISGATTVSGGLDVSAATTFHVGATVTCDDQFEALNGALLQGTVVIDSPAISGTTTITGGATYNGQPLAVEIAATTVNSGGTPLSGIASASLTPGATVAWVESVGALFQLQISALTVDHITVETASGLGGAQWLRLALPNRAFWKVSTWHIDPVSGSDEATGTGSGANALKTNAEWSRRLVGSTVGTVTVLWDNDIPDGDSMIIPCNGALIGIAGAETVVSTQTVASAQSRNPALNHANEITVTGFNWTPFVGMLLRQQGTLNYAAITKAVSLGVARLGELVDFGTVADPNGITSGVVEIVQTRKGPLLLQAVGSAPLDVEDVRFDGAGQASIELGYTSAGESVFNNVILGGTSSYMSTPLSLLWLGGIFRQQTLTSGVGIECQGGAFMGGSFEVAAIYNKWRSCVAQATTLNLIGPGILHLDADFGQFDTAAAAVGINLSSTTSSGENTTLTMQSGRHYGSGNNATAHVWNVGAGCIVMYAHTTPPTQDAGLGVRINASDVALGSLPVNLSLTNGSAVYAL